MMSSDSESATSTDNQQGQPKPFFEVPVRPRIENPVPSEERVKMVQGWIANCQQFHEQCLPKSTGLITKLPKRVLDVSQALVTLYEPAGATGRYACLSHCWGTSRPACRTTKSTLQANLRGMANDTLPATFLDAIDFTRRLGIDYLW